jgi:NAD(P)H-dependent flavin oxidoreductase YrpB (nitropropane dioxygenase family)
MKSPVCEMLGIEFPLMAFTHCRDVVAEVSKAGGFGVLGAAGFTPETLEMELKWIDDNIDGKPYGVDLIAPNKLAVSEGHDSVEEIGNMIPDEIREFTAGILDKHDVDSKGIYEGQVTTAGGYLTKEKSVNIIDVAFTHPIKMIVNALGVPPQYMMDIAKEKGVVTGALVGAREHALKQAKAGVDILIASGTEAGGHCGEVSTMVLIPEVCEAVKDYDCCVVAAGGIMTGRQMAAAMAMGADGAWTGSVWLTVDEAETSPVIIEKFLEATSRQTVRSQARTGKFSRQLRSPWHDAWESATAPDTLPMPLQGLVSEPALSRIVKAAEDGHAGAKDLATFFVGQGVGLMNRRQSTKSVVLEYMEDFIDAQERLTGFLEE